MRRLLSWLNLDLRRRRPAGLRLLFVFGALLAGATQSFLAAATFTATLDRETVTVGETATLTLKIEGGQPKAWPALPRLPNLQMAGGGTSQSYSLIDGQSSSSVSQAFALTPTQPGMYTIPALSAQVDGQVLTTQPLKLTAVKAEATAGDSGGEKLAFFKLFVPRKEVYVGEVLGVEFQVCVREGLANAENILQSFDQYGGCPLKAEGVSIL